MQPETSEREREEEKICEKIMDKNVSDMMKTTNPQIQEAQ